MGWQGFGTMILFGAVRNTWRDSPNGFLQIKNLGHREKQTKTTGFLCGPAVAEMKRRKSWCHIAKTLDPNFKQRGFEIRKNSFADLS